MKNVLITGASRGIGKALAQKFLAERFFVIGTSTKGASDSDIVDQNFIMWQLDLTDPKSIKSCAEKIINSQMPLDILINNAGAVWPERNSNGEREININTLRKTLETNLIGP